MLEINSWFIEFFSTIRNPILDGLFVFGSVIVDFGFWYWIAVYLLMKKLKFFKYYLGGMLVGALVQEFILKNIFRVVRPCQLLGSYIVECPSSFSFPSGHSTSSFLAATMIYGYNKKAGILAYVFAGIVAVSRVYLNVHYFTDVFIGMILGIFFGMIVLYIMKRNENIM